MSGVRGQWYVRWEVLKNVVYLWELFTGEGKLNCLILFTNNSKNLQKESGPQGHMLFTWSSYKEYYSISAS